MRFDSFIVWLVVLGLLFSLKGRVEPELAAGWTSNGLGVMSVAEKDDEAFPMGQTRPLGARTGSSIGLPGAGDRRIGDRNDLRTCPRRRHVQD